MLRTLVALLAAALLVAGCGGDDNDSAGEESGTTPSAQTAPADDNATDGGDSGDSGADADEPTSSLSDEQLEQAAETCKENVANAPQLSDDAKEDLEKLCEEAASGDPDDVRELSIEVCKRIVADTLPEGEQRDQALGLCEETEQ